jgi:hypothetical protein
MASNKLTALVATFAFAGLAACGGADQTTERTEREILTQPTTETVEVDVLTEDTLMVERTIQTEVHTDTIRNPDQRDIRGATGTTDTLPRRP